MFSHNVLYLVHAMFGGRGFRGFVLIAIGKMEILATFRHDEIKIIRRYEGWYYTKLYHVIIFYLETDWSRIHPLPSTTLTLLEYSAIFCFIL